MKIYNRDERRAQLFSHQSLLVAPLTEHGAIQVSAEVLKHLTQCLLSEEIDYLSKICILKHLLLQRHDALTKLSKSEVLDLQKSLAVLMERASAGED